MKEDAMLQATDIRRHPLSARPAFRCDTERGSLPLTHGNWAIQHMDIEAAESDPTDRTLVANDTLAKFKLAAVNTSRLPSGHAVSSAAGAAR